MVKPIILTDNETGEQYTLEFNRESIYFAEHKGFCIDDVDRYPMTKVPELFFYAFRMHHKNIAKEKTDKILFEKIEITDELMTRLGELYAAPFEVLTPSVDGKSKNGKMTVEL